MIFCLVVIGICVLLGVICKISVLAGEVKLGSMAETVFRSGELTVMKKSFICVFVTIFCLLSVAAYADETTVTPSPTMDVIPSLIEEEEINVDAPVITPEPDSVPAYDGDTQTTVSGDSGDSDSPVPTATPEPTPTVTPAPTSEPVSESWDTGVAVISDVETTPASYDEQTLQVLGNIQAYLLFFVVVTLLYFCYKFLRMFF